MLNSIIQSSLNNRFFVIMATILIGGMGVYSALHLPIDAVPDLTNVQVQVITEVAGAFAGGSRRDALVSSFGRDERAA